jgi:hypothetical protein
VFVCGIAGSREKKAGTEHGRERKARRKEKKMFLEGFGVYRVDELVKSHSVLRDG